MARGRHGGERLCVAKCASHDQGLAAHRDDRGVTHYGFPRVRSSVRDMTSPSGCRRGTWYKTPPTACSTRTFGRAARPRHQYRAALGTRAVRPLSALPTQVARSCAVSPRPAPPQSMMAVRRPWSMSKLPGIRSAVNESFDDWFDRDLERFSGKQLTAATSMRRAAFHSGLSNHPSRRSRSGRSGPPRGAIKHECP